MQTDLPRYTKPNPYNYTQTQLNTRTSALREMVKDYPNVPPMWCEWLYDVITNKSQEEVENIINNKLWETPSKFAVAPGGTLNSVECFNEDFTPYIFPENKITE